MNRSQSRRRAKLERRRKRVEAKGARRGFSEAPGRRKLSPSELQQAIAASRRIVERCDAEIAEASVEHEAAAAELEKLNGSIRDMESECDRHDIGLREAARLRDRADAQYEASQVAYQERRAVDKRLKRRHERIAKLRAELATLEGEVAELNAEHAKLTRRMTSCRSKRNQWRARAQLAEQGCGATIDQLVAARRMEIEAVRVLATAQARRASEIAERLQGAERRKRSHLRQIESRERKLRAAQPEAAV